MPKRLTSIVCVLFAGTALVAGGQAATAKIMITRVQRCNALQQQFNKAITQHAEAKRAAEARAFQKKAQKFCAGKEQAQGIRAYAKALKLLGVPPIDQ